MSNGAGHAFIPIWICSVWGLPGCLLLNNRCALTAPFHPYRQSSGEWQVVSDESQNRRTFAALKLITHPLTTRHCFIGGIFSVALSVPDQDLRPSQAPRVTGHTTLWSSDFPPAQPAED